MPFPGWLAVIEQVPPPTMVTVDPLMVHTAIVLDVKVTESEELAEAEIVYGETP